MSVSFITTTNYSYEMMVFFYLVFHTVITCFEVGTSEHGHFDVISGCFSGFIMLYHETKI